MKILFLHKRSLFPADTGGKIRTLNVLKHLAKWHEITYLCNVLPEEEPHLARMSDLGLNVVAIPWKEAARDSFPFYFGLASNLLSKYPYSVNKDFDKRVRSKAIELLSNSEFNLLICDFVQMARNVLDVGPIPKILFQHNVEAQIYRRLADNEPNVFKRMFIRRQQLKMEAFERSAGKAFDQSIAVSPQDKQMFEEDYGWKHVTVIDTAVDTEYFRPENSDRIEGRLAFIGSMDWRPNQEGILRFAKRVFPSIRERYPNATLDIVGRNPPAFIKRLSSYPGVVVTGKVEDVRPYISRASMTVVPIYSGGGTRLKIFESMAMGTPVVSTPLGADGLNIGDGKHMVCADSDQQFADAVCKLLGSAQGRHLLAAQALKHVSQNYSSEIIAKQFNEICRMTVECGSHTRVRGKGT